MNKRDTLVILSPGFPKDEADTACIPPQQVFVRTLKQQYPSLHIIILAFQYPYYSAEYQWNGVSVISFEGKNKGGVFRFLVWTQVLLKLRAINKNWKIIGVLSFWIGECTLIASRFAKKNRLKYYGWVLGQDARQGNNYINRIKPAADNIIAISDFVAEEFRRNYRLKPGHTIPVGIDPAMFPRPSAHRDIDILGAGSLIRLKQYHQLISLIDRLHESYPKIHAVVSGKGAEKEGLRNMVKEFQLNENIELAGELPHAEVLKLMTRTKVFVHPSSYEGFSTVCLEALNAGAQVVSFIKPMQVDIKNWHIAKSPEEMLRIVTSMLENPPEKYDAVAPYLAKDSVAAIMKLFGYNDAAIS